MAMPRALAAYWAKHGRGARKNRRGTSSPPRSPSAPKPSVWARVKAGLRPADPLSMGLFGLAGYLLPNALTSTGLPWAAYNASKASSSPLVRKYAAAVDAMYASAGEADLATGEPNPWSNGGASGWGKIAGVGLAGKVIYDSAKSGRLSNRNLNVTGPLALGLILDPPQGGSSGSSVSEDGW